MTTRLLKRIKREAKKEKTRAKFKGKVEVEENEVIRDFKTGLPIKNSFEGYINQQNKDIHMEYKPSYEEKKPGKTLEVMVTVERHEINHIGDARLGNRGCPRNLSNHKMFYEVAKDILFPQGFSQDDLQYMVNVFEDFVDNVNLADGFDIEGLVRFYEDVGEATGFSDFFEAFVKLQAIFFPKKYKHLLQKFYKHKPKIKEVIDNFLNRAGLNMQTELYKGVDVRDKRAMLNYINNEGNWAELMRIFTEEFSKLMEPGYALPIPGLSGAGTKGYSADKEDEKDGKGKGDEGKKEGEEDSDKEGEGKGDEESEDKGADAGDDTGDDDFDDGDDDFDDDGIEKPDVDWDKIKGGNYFDKEMKDPEKRKALAYEDYIGGKGRPDLIDYYEALNAVYERLARRLNIKGEVMTKTMTVPLTWYGKRKFDPNRDKPKHLAFGFDDKGEIEIQKKRWHTKMPLEYKVAHRGFPEARFVMLDTSGSMGGYGNSEYIPWGKHSKYHYALLAWYGFLEYLKKNHLLKKTTTSLANFSGSTILAKGLDEAKRNALRPQFGGTYLNMDKIKEMFQGNGSLMFTISDGEIDNWSSIKEDFIKSAQKHYYFHLQIGGQNRVSADLEEARIPVYYVNGEEDLWKKVINIADTMYRKAKDTTRRGRPPEKGYNSVMTE